MGIDNIDEMLKHLTAQNRFLLNVCDKLSDSIEKGEIHQLDSMNQSKAGRQPVKPMQNQETLNTKIQEYEALKPKQMQQLEAPKIRMSKKLHQMDAVADNINYDYGIFQQEIDWIPDALSLYHDLANIHAAQLQAQMKRTCDDDCGLCNLKGRIDFAINQLLRPEMKWDNEVAGVENESLPAPPNAFPSGEPTCPEGYRPNPELMLPPNAGPPNAYSGNEPTCPVGYMPDPRQFPRPSFQQAEWENAEPPMQPLRSGRPMDMNADLGENTCPEGFVPVTESMPQFGSAGQMYPEEQMHPEGYGALPQIEEPTHANADLDDDTCPEGYERAPQGLMSAAEMIPVPTEETTLGESQETAPGYGAPAEAAGGEDEGNNYYDTVVTAVAAASLISAVGVLLYCKKNQLKEIPQQFSKLVAGVSGSTGNVKQRVSDMCKGAAANETVNKIKNLVGGKGAEGNETVNKIKNIFSGLSF